MLYIFYCLHSSNFFMNFKLFITKKLLFTYFLVLFVPSISLFNLLSRRCTGTIGKTRTSSFYYQKVNIHNSGNTAESSPKLSPLKPKCRWVVLKDRFKTLTFYLRFDLEKLKNAFCVHIVHIE